MKRIISTGIAFCLVATGSLFAQANKLTVKNGQKFSYEMKSDGVTTQSMGGQEMSIDSKMEGTIELMAKKVGKEQINWSYGIPKMKMTMESPMGAMDTTIKSKPVDFTTDLSGKLLNAMESDPAMQMLSGAFQGSPVENLFSPALGRTLKAGDTWEISAIDTMSNPMMGGDMYINRTIRYQYDGTVDTLKTKAARIRAEATSMTIQGSGEVMGNSVTVDGDGAMVLTGYYSMKDGVLLANAVDMEMSMRIAVAGQMEQVIPVTVKGLMSMVRK